MIKVWSGQPYPWCLVRRLAVNLGSRRATIELPDGPWRFELASVPEVAVSPGRLSLPPTSVALLLPA